MSKTKRLLISMLTLLYCCTGTWALEQDGEGYYLIGSVQDWKDTKNVYSSEEDIDFYTDGLDDDYSDN